MERITDRMLDFQLERLNDQTKCRYQIGRSYGYYHLERASMECTGIDSVSLGNTKRELYYQIQTHLKIQEAEKNRKANEALDNTIFNDSAKDSRYVKYDSKRESQVTFGKK